MRVLMVSFGGDDNPRTYKIIESLRSDGHDVLFVGWERDPSRKKRSIVPADRIFLYDGGWKGVFSRVKHLIKYYHYVFLVVKNSNPDVVHCINEEAAILLFPFKRFLFRFLVLDIYDGLTERVCSSNKIVISVLSFLSKITYKVSDVIFVCDKRRFSKMVDYEDKLVILENTPNDPGACLADDIPSENITIALVGNMTKRRGTDAAICALNNNPGVRFLIAGYLDDYSKKLFLNNAQVNYVGVITPEKSLELVASCDAALAFYEPDTENHIYASPSKLFDCLSVGRPIVINSEVMVSEWVVENNLGYSCSYYDCDALSEIFKSLITARKDLYLYSKELRKFYMDGYSWGVMSDRLLNTYSQMGSERDVSSV